MKKIILSCAILCGCLTFAQTATPTTTSTTTTSTETAQTQTATPKKIDAAALEGIARNIDRRLVYFNRYKQSEDMESLAKLVSEENKDFYINFMKYLKSAPVFTLKRDIKGNIIKTPTDEYVIQAFMTLNGTEKRVAMTFVEEKGEQGSKWLIYNSNLHIQVPLGKTNTNLGSSAIKDTTTQNPPPKTTTPPPSDQTEKNLESSTVNTPSKTTPSLPVIKNEGASDDVKQIKPVGGGIDMTTIIFISIASVVILGGVFGYYFMRKNKKAKIAAVSAAAAAVSATASTESNINSSPETLSNTVPLPPSNVGVSTVEEIHGISPSTAENLPSNITIVQDSFEEITPIKDETPPTTSTKTSEDPTPSEVNATHEEAVSPVETVITQTNTAEQDVSPKSTETQEVSSPSSIVPENVSTPVENNTEHLPTTEETPIMDVSTTPIPTDTPVTQKPETPADTPVENMQPHALFDGIFDAASPENNNQNPINTAS